MAQQTPPPPPGAGQIAIELPDDVAQGQYSNLMFITHSPSEFVLDFARALPGVRKGKVYSRIIMTPQHAKALNDLLGRNLQTFEEKHGAIKVAGKTGDETKIGFLPVTPSEPGATSDG